VDPQDQKRKPPSLLSNRPVNPTPSQPSLSVTSEQPAVDIPIPTRPAAKSSPGFWGIALLLAALLLALWVFRFIFNREPADTLQNSAVATTTTTKIETGTDASEGRASVYRSEDIEAAPNPNDAAAVFAPIATTTVTPSNGTSTTATNQVTQTGNTQASGIEKALNHAPAPVSVDTKPAPPLPGTPKTAIQSAPIAASAGNRKAPNHTSTEVADSNDSDVALIEALMGSAKTQPAPKPSAPKEKVVPAVAKENIKEKDNARLSVAQQLRKCPAANTADGVSCRVKICADIRGKDPACPNATANVETKTKPSEKTPAVAKTVVTPEPVAQLVAPVAPAAPEPEPIINKRKLVLVSSAEPKYPSEALRANVTGQVTASMTVNADGSVANIKIIDAKPRIIFDRPVKEALKQWRFEPIKEAQTITRTFSFSPGNQDAKNGVAKK
jgi:TonB family protein